MCVCVCVCVCVVEEEGIVLVPGEGGRKGFEVGPLKISERDTKQGVSSQQPSGSHSDMGILLCAGNSVCGGDGIVWRIPRTDTAARQQQQKERETDTHTPKERKETRKTKSPPQEFENIRTLPPSLFGIPVIHPRVSALGRWARAPSGDPPLPIGRE